MNQYAKQFFSADYFLLWIQDVYKRQVKILLENGNLEVLATNLSQTEFHTEEIKE